MKVKVLEDGLELTKGEVYDVIRITPFNNIVKLNDHNIIIEIINEYGKWCQYYFPSIYFEDVTTKIRDSIIDGILR